MHNFKEISEIKQAKKALKHLENANIALSTVSFNRCDVVNAMRQLDSWIDDQEMLLQLEEKKTKGVR